MEIQKICYIARLIFKYIQSPITEEEQTNLNNWKNKSLDHQKLFDFFCNHTFMEQKQIEEKNFDDEKAYQKVFHRKEKQFRKKTIRKIYSISIVAAIISSVIITILIKFSTDPNEKSPQYQCITSSDRKAILTLADGSSFVLSDTNIKDTLIDKEEYQIIREAGKISYNEKEKKSQLKHNTLKVPRGGEYIITLSDGTTVHLNSASDLRYPEQFVGNERRVFLSGEAYFVIAKDSIKPFYVEINDLNIKAYGTSFNVNTHVKGKIQTVLVEGKIGIQSRKQKEEFIIRPSQLATYDIAQEKMKIQEVNTRSHTAWREGWFLFENERLEDVLNQLSLWYDIEVTYTHSSIKELRIFGSMKHYDSIQVILRAIEKNVKVHFKINNRVIIVSE